ncbi:MAG: GNAT family N-acetyltransferase [Victivallales bacterium]|nr:GNAT family N-acetyltransferase [Victivallales bacterium]
MLDKSLTYQGFIMKLRREKLQNLTVPELPAGYHYRLYRPGDDVHWARLEHLVNEFATFEAALDYFRHDYSLPFEDELCRRCAFVCTEDDVPVATATAWFMESSLGHKSWLQWISTDPAHQGKGLGRGVIAKALSLYPEVGPESDIYLHTQTWSHKAIYLYHRIGFEFSLMDNIRVAWHKEPGFRVMTNSPLEALEVLKAVYSPELIQELHDQAEKPTEDERTEHEILPPFPEWYTP